MGPIFPRRFFLGLAFFAGVLAAAYLGWSYRKANPTFRPYTSPNGEYTVSLPDQPQWYVDPYSFEGAFMPSAVVERGSGFWAEAYRVRVVWLDRKGGRRNPEEVAVKWARARDANALLVTAPNSYAAAEFEMWNAPARGQTAGRVVVVKDFAYELTVTGRGITLSDRRVQQFFDSFRVGR
jgi:hypothetical protein